MVQPAPRPALDKASLVLVPPEASLGVMQMAGFVLKLGGGLRQPMGKALEDQLPPDLKARFIESATRPARARASTRTGSRAWRASCCCRISARRPGFPKPSRSARSSAWPRPAS
jgi:hypothetical protein